MNDRELLELAAKAIGEKIVGELDGWALLEGVQEGWNPLRSDGDALRLAASVGVHIQFDFDDEHVRKVIVYGIDTYEEPDASDRMAQVRRAIVRAAAEIGGSK